jgi:hypothetical protein
MAPRSGFDLLVNFLPGVAAMARKRIALPGRRLDLPIKPALKPRIRHPYSL